MKSSNTLLWAAFLAVFSIAFIWLLQDRIGIRDCDDYAYITGAYSIQRGAGYTDLAGNPLNHWPPGYSFILSLFPDPIRAALFINYISFGLCVGLIYLLARKNDWHWQAALSLSLVMGPGWLRIIATETRPDILTYVLFLSGIYIYTERKGLSHMLSYIIWCALIPLKFVALVFTPAALAVDWMPNGQLRKDNKGYAATASIVLSWMIFLGLIVIFNYRTIGAAIPSSHSLMNAAGLLKEFTLFIVSFFRSFLCSWYGSIRDIKVFIPFCICIVTGLACLSTLRMSSRSGIFAKLAVMIMITMFLLAFIRKFYFVPRLTGYGLIILFFAFKPSFKTKSMWALYAALSVSMAVFNSFYVNSLGVNDPRYKNLADRLAASGLPAETIYTNSYHILDIHAKVPSEPVTDIVSLKKDSYFLWINLPNYDAIATIVQPIAKPGAGWREIFSADGAILFQKK